MIVRSMRFSVGSSRALLLSSRAVLCSSRCGCGWLVAGRARGVAPRVVGNAVVGVVRMLQVTESFGKGVDGETVRKAVVFQAGKDGRLSVASALQKDTEAPSKQHVGGGYTWGAGLRWGQEGRVDA